MTIEEINDSESRTVLSRGTMGRLGCSHENQPYVVPVFFAYEPDYVYMFSTVGQKIEWMRTNPKVCLQVDEITNHTQWVSVIAYGTYEELSEPRRSVERTHARELLEKKHQWWANSLAERRERADEVSIDPVFFRIHIYSVSGLRARAEGS